MRGLREGILRVVACVVTCLLALTGSGWAAKRPTGQAAMRRGVDRSAGAVSVFKDMYFDILSDNGRVFEYAATSETRRIEPGDILWHGTYDTTITLRRVTRVLEKDNGAVVVVYTEPVRIGELADSVYVSLQPGVAEPVYESIQYPDGRVEKWTSDERLLEISHDPALRRMDDSGRGVHAMGVVSSVNTLEIPLIDETDLPIYSGETEDGEGSPVDYSGKLTVTAKHLSLVYRPTFDFGFETSGTHLVNVHATVSGDLTFRSDLRVDISVAGNYVYKKLLLRYGKWFVVQVGIVPVPLKAEVKVYGIAEVNATATGYVQAGLQRTVSHEQGLSWDDVSGWQTVSTFTPGSWSLYNTDPASTGGEPTWAYDGKVSAELRAEPVIGLYLAGQLGPEIVPAPSLRADAALTGSSGSSTDFDWGVYGCFTTWVRFSLQSLGGDATDLADWRIYQDCRTLYPDFTGHAGSGAGSGNSGSEADNDVSTIGVPALVSPADGQYTNDLTPTFSWTSVAEAEKYEIAVGKYVFETTGTTFTPPAQLRPQMQAVWKVRAYRKGRWGNWSEERKVDIGVQVSSGNAFYGQLNVGDSVSVTDPSSGNTYYFLFYDIDSNVSPYQVLVYVYDDPGFTHLVDTMIAAYRTPVRVDAVPGLFIEPFEIWDAGGCRWASLMIAPYVEPQLRILEPEGGTVTGDTPVRVEVSYAGQGVSWQVPPGCLCSGGGGSGQFLSTDAAGTSGFSAPEGEYISRLEGYWSGGWGYITAHASGGSSGDILATQDTAIYLSDLTVPPGKHIQKIGPNGPQYLGVWLDDGSYLGDLIYNAGSSNTWTFTTYEAPAGQKITGFTSGPGTLTAVSSADCTPRDPTAPVDPFDMKTVCYNGTCTSEDSFTWTMSGPEGERTMTVTLTDLFGKSITREVTVYYLPCSAPGTPGAPSFSNLASDSVTVSWADVANEMGYRVQRCQGAGCTSFVDVSPQLAKDTTSFTDTGLSPGTTYSYRVVALSCGGTDATGPSASVTAPPAQAVIFNGGFETTGGWTTETIGGSVAPVIDLQATDGPYEGSYYAKITNTLGSMGTERAGFIRQTFTVPSDATTLSYAVKYWKDWWGACIGTKLNGTVLEQYCPGGQRVSSGWTVRSLDITAYRGQTVTFEIFLDDRNGYWSGNGDHGAWIGVDAVAFTATTSVVNGGFETSGGWTAETIGGSVAPTIDLQATDGPYEGSHYAKITNTLGSMGTERAGFIRQTFTVPSDATTLSYAVKYWKDWWGACIGTKLNGTVLEQYCPGGQPVSSGWTVRSFDITAYRGQTVTFEIFLDDRNGYWSGNGDHGAWIGVDAVSVGP